MPLLPNQKGKRTRGRVLTESGRRKINDAIAHYAMTQGFDRKKISRKKIAELATLSEDTISKLLRSEKPVDLSSIQLLMRAFDVELEPNVDFKKVNLQLPNREHLKEECLNHNLPHQDNAFIGRSRQINDLLSRLSLSYRMPIVLIEGIGGVGKTALVLEAAYKCLEAQAMGASDCDAPTYDAIIFASAKTYHLLDDGIKEYSGSQHKTLDDLFKVIAHTLKDKRIIQSPPEKQRAQVYESLKKQKTLLIVDNLETVEIKDRDEIIEFLLYLPQTTKAVITTREQVFNYGSIRLNELTEEESRALIKQQAHRKGVELDTDSVTAIYKRFQGIPIALIYAVGQLAGGYGLSKILRKQTSLPSDIASFCFDSSMKSLRKSVEYKLLTAIAFFDTAPHQDFLAAVTELDVDSLEEGLARLHKLSLIQRQKNCFYMLPLTRQYALAELKKHPQLEEMMRKNWVDLYLTFARKNGGRDWADWGRKYKQLESEWSNLMAVLDWCKKRGLYDNAKELWNCLNCCSSLRGHWCDRVSWHEYLIEEAGLRGDIETTVDSMSQKSYTLILMSELDEAESCLQTAAQLCPSTDFMRQTFLVQHKALLMEHRNQYALAKMLIHEAENLLEKAIDFTEPNKERRRISLLSQKAFLYYQMENYDQAKSIYRAIYSDAKRLNWNRKANSIRNGLANIAIHQGDLEEARESLIHGLHEAKSNNHIRRVGLFQTSLAHVDFKEENLSDACSSATNAIEIFTSLGLKREEQKVRSLLKTHCTSSTFC